MKSVSSNIYLVTSLVTECEKTLKTLKNQGFLKNSVLFPLYYKAFISPIFRLFLVSFISVLSENTASKKRVSFLLVRFWYAVKSAMYLSISTVEFFIKIFLWYSTANNNKALV